MSDPSEDEKRLAEIEARFNKEDDISFDDADFIWAIARDGLKWRKAAAAESEVEASNTAFESAFCGDVECDNNGNACICMKDALQAASAWRKAHGEDVEALKARVAELEKRVENLRGEAEGSYSWRLCLLRTTRIRVGWTPGDIIHCVPSRGGASMSIAGDSQPILDSFAPGRLWSLWDMLRIRLSEYLMLGMEIHEHCAGILFREDDSEYDKNNVRERQKSEIRKFYEAAKLLDLPITTSLLESKIDDPPNTISEFNMIWCAMQAELKSKLFLSVPHHRAKYYECNDLCSVAVRISFPLAVSELRSAGNCFASGLSTACVFHSMRALEHGLRALAADVNKDFDVQNWHVVIEQIESAIRELSKTLPNSQEKSERLQFLSEAAKEFFYFKDGWRNHVSHGRCIYEESHALTVMTHVQNFFETLAKRLKEKQ